MEMDGRTYSMLKTGGRPVGGMIVLPPGGRVDAGNVDGLRDG
jgi:hypothetical protein